MYLGRIVEVGTRSEIFDRPRHPYTRALLKAAPSLAGTARPARAACRRASEPARPPPGCVFYLAARASSRSAGRGAPRLAPVAAAKARPCGMPVP